MTVDEFRSSLCQYFDNGSGIRFDVLPEIIQRLESLYEVINSLFQYRFYSASLLIVYDGSPTSKIVDVRMIDFANTVCKAAPINDEPSNNHIGPDKGYLYGLESLMGYFREISNNNGSILQTPDTNEE